MKKRLFVIVLLLVSLVPIRPVYAISKEEQLEPTYRICIHSNESLPAPTCKFSIDDDGNVVDTFYDKYPKAKIHYNEVCDSEELPYKLKGITYSGKSLHTDCTHDDFEMYATYKGETSNLVEYDFYNKQHAKYKEKVKVLAGKITSGLVTEEDKLDALWSWEQMNTEYAFKDNGEADTRYYNGEDALWKGKTVCHGFACLWKDLTESIGIKTDKIESTALNHVWCITKVKGKWFFVDPTHNEKVTDIKDVDYTKFLNNAQANYSTNFYKHDCSSHRYNIVDGFANTIFTNKYYVEPGKYYFDYDAANDQYKLISNIEPEDNLYIEPDYKWYNGEAE